MPSYLSSTQTVGPEPRDDLGGVLGRRGEHELERVEQRHLRRRRAGPSRASIAVRPMSPVSMPARLTASSGRSNAFASAASSSPSRRPIRSSPREHLDDRRRGPRRRTGRRAPRAARPCAAAPDACLDRLERRRGSRRAVGSRVGSRRVAGLRRARRRPRSRRRRTGRTPGASASASAPATRRTAPAIAAQPIADRPLVGLGERPAGEEHGRDRQRLGVERGEVVGEDRRLLGRLRRGRDGVRRPRSSGACGRWYRVAAMLHRRWFPDHIEGSLVVLRRHSRDNLRDFLRWYQDPEVARLTRYQDGPMRPDEIERFFTMRALGTGQPRDGHPRPRDEPAHRLVRVQPARRRQRLGAVPHHDRRAGRLGPRLRRRGDAR